MKLQEFLAHHGLADNPFSVEDAQSDAVFKEHCIQDTFHPAWDKVYGNPIDPSTSIVFGEKGAGKTALRLQLRQHLARFNDKHPLHRCFVISYDDFNPFLDQFRERLNGRTRPERLLREFRLWDHIDAILSIGVTELLNQLFQAAQSREDSPGENAVDRDYRKHLRGHQRRDLLLLAACYDHSMAASQSARWHRLQRRLHAWNFGIWWPFAAGIAGIAAAFPVTHWLTRWLATPAELESGISWFRTLLILCSLVLVAWIPWLWRSGHRWWLAWSIAHHLRVLPRRIFPLSRLLMDFSADQLSDQPLPNRQRTDDRYALLAKLQSILQSLGFSHIVVLVDRVDEPYLINGAPELMRAFVWPMLDNKFLKHPGLAMKFMLPQELATFIERESQDFYQRARLDKQNVVPSLAWTGPALFDLVNTRMAACSRRQPPAKLLDLLDESLTERRVYDALASLRVPRHVFRFLYRVMSAHVNRHSQESPSYRISPEIFESEFALYRREQDAADRGLAPG